MPLDDQHDKNKDEPQESAFGWAWEEYPFDLSGHGALMLHIGIEEYMRRKYSSRSAQRQSSTPPAVRRRGMTAV
jgi:hypothetical protein